MQGNTPELFIRTGVELQQGNFMEEMPRASPIVATGASSLESPRAAATRTGADRGTGRGASRRPLRASPADQLRPRPLGSRPSAAGAPGLQRAAGADWRARNQPAS